MAEIIADVREPITQVEVEISDEEKRKKELKVGWLFDHWWSKEMVLDEEEKGERWEEMCVWNHLIWVWVAALLLAEVHSF